MNKKYRYPFAVKKVGPIAGHAKYLKCRHMLVVLRELTNHRCTVVEGKCYSPDVQCLKFQCSNNAS